MAESNPRENTFSKALAMHVKKRAFDVKFELNVEDYTPIENIGIGAYGVVCSAIHNKTNDRVAIKKIPNVFDVKDIAKRTYREIKILKHFKHDNIIHIREALKPNESIKDFRDVYVVFDLMESDLHKIIYSKQELTEEHVRFFLYQILRGLKYIHSAQVIHRDLKPSNLLVNEDCQLKIGDFGMARGFSSSPTEPNFFMTQYVATRWYRAPEIMLSLIEYGAAVDMWSVGCIFAEMLGRKHLFPGKDAISQIKLIVGIAGSPDQSLLQLCHSPIIRNFIQEMGHKEAIPWSKLFPKASKKAIHLLSRMLVLHPKDRITVEKALVHPYLNKYHDPDDEPICVPVFNFDFENEDLNLPQLREVIHKEIMQYHQPRTPTLSFNALLRPVPKSPDVMPAGELKIDPSQGQSLQLTQPGKIVPELKLESESSHSKGKENESELVIKTGSLQDDGVFKRPLSAKNEEATVRVDVKGLLKVDANDIEMLSAKSTDVKQPMSGVVTEVIEAKENQEPMKEEKNKTVSEDTKNQIRAALKNASFRKRTDSVGDDERRKPITAAMRQKEREDRRKKKFERTNERKKKDKKKPASNEILTSEDKELLERWAKMQKVNVPIAPKPPSEVTVVEGQGQDVSDYAQPVYRPGSRQSDGSNNSNQVKGDISKGHGQSDINRGEGHRGCEGSRAVQPETMNLLQQRLLSGIHDNRNNGNQGLLPQVPVEGDRGLDGSNTANTGTLMQNNLPGYISQANNDNCEQNQSNLGSGRFSVDFSSVGLGDLDFLSMVTSPELTRTVSVSNSDPSSQLHNQQSLGIPNALLSENNTINKNSSEAGGSTFLQRLCSETSPPQSVATVGHLPLSESVEHRSPSHLSVSPGYPNSVSPSNIYSSHSPGSQHSVSPNLSASPSHPFESSLNTVQQQQQQQQQQHHQQHQLLQQLQQQGNQQPQQYQQQHQPQTSAMPFQMNTMIVNESDPNNPFVGTSQTQNQSASLFLNTNLSENQPVGAHPVPNFPFGSTSSGFQTQDNGNQSTNQAGSLSGPSFPFGNSTTGYQGQENSIQSSQPGPSNLYRNQSAGNGGQESHNNSSSNSNSPPALSINTRQAQLSYQHLFQPMPGPSDGVTDMTQTQVDLVALLTKQFSKSNVEDICPQLALTPRGTGGGYGVGVDLDSIMTGQEADSNTGEPPLSSSILADWMEEIGNMNIDIEALEQELQSPMVLSYNDINLYSS